MHFRGFTNLCFFYAVWLGAVFIFPIAIIGAYFRIWIPLIIVVLYYSYRFCFPAKKWDWMRLALDCDSTPYCRKSDIILCEGAVVPQQDSRVLTTVAPHGILTLGWSYIISSKLYFNSGTKWLVAPAMMNLPFIGDIMRWTSCYSCEPNSMRKIMATGSNIGLIPGGFQEATYYKRGKFRVYLKNRKGFIKVLYYILILSHSI